jgi:hypothetical protein
VESSGFGCPLGIPRAAEAEKAAKSMTLPILLIELAKPLIGIGALAAAVFVAKMLRNSK